MNTAPNTNKPRRNRRRALLASLVRIEWSVRPAAAFVAVCAASAGVAWLGGYDFQTRDPAVALGVVVSLVAALLAAMLASSDS